MTRMPIVTLLAVALLLAGCTETEKGPTGGGVVTTADRKVALRSAIDQRFENPRAHYELGKIYRDEGLWEQAEFHFGVVTRIAPTHWPARAALVRLLTDRKRTADASVAVRSFVGQTASPVELMRLTQAFRNEGLEGPALEALQEGLKRWPDSALIYKQLGLYYLAKEDHRQAEQYLRRSFELDGHQPDVAYELGKLGVIIETPKPKNAPPQEQPAESEAAAEDEAPPSSTVRPGSPLRDRIP